MLNADDKAETLVAQAMKAMDEWEKIPPGERFVWMVKIGLVDEQGRLRRDQVEQVPISRLFEGRNGGSNGNGHGAGGGV